MKRSQVEMALEAAFAADEPIYISGPPGVGKSSVVRQTAERLDMGCVVAPLPEFDVVDIRGLPSVKNGNGPGKTQWNPPDLFFGDGAHERYVIFLDELPNAPTLVQSGALRLVQERRVAEQALPAGARIAAAGNRITDKAGAGRLLTSLADRFFSVDMEPDLGDWVDWALGADIPVEVIAFLRWRPALLSTFKASEQVFATPRSWEKVGRLLAHLPREIEHMVVSGTVGEGPATEFVSFLRIYRDLPDIDGLLLSPKETPVPREPGTLYALSTALGARVTKDTAESMLIYAGRMPAEFAVLTVKDAMRRDSTAISHSKAFIQFTMKHKEVLS